MQGFGVLVAAAGERWRARILTYPNVLWTVPGGGSSIKFYARSVEEVERKAIAFIRQHCAVRSYVLRDELQPVGLDEFLRAHPGDPADAVVREPRFRRVLPVRFGLSRPTVIGRTGNLSESGLFVTTPHPLGEGALAGLLLELEHSKVPLRGSVIWNRALPGLGRDPGMGLVLLNPPTIYVRYVQALG
jgi:hypothetical protein